jgi:N-acetylneuraminic acid mutarotase
MEKIPYMYRMHLIENEFEDRDYENHYEKKITSDAKSTSMKWERIVPHVKEPPPDFTGIGSVSNSYDNLFQMVNRGEVRGGYMESEDKLVIYGGLHVRQYEVNFGHKQQADETLGDVWAYDFQTNTWEMLSPAWSNGERPHPGSRTSHGSVVVGDELLITGGLREEEMYVWDGTTVWQQLDDVWVFNLKTGLWKERMMLSPIGRSYQSTVGFQTDEKSGSVIVSFGGFKSVME